MRDVGDQHADMGEPRRARVLRLCARSERAAARSVASPCCDGAGSARRNTDCCSCRSLLDCSSRPSRVGAGVSPSIPKGFVQARPMTFALAIGVIAVAFAPPTLAEAQAKSQVLPVVRCSTTYAVPRGQSPFRPPHGVHPPAIPRKLVGAVTGAVGRQLAFYSNGWISLIAPRGWHCSGGVGRDGSLVLTVLPPHVSHVTTKAAAVTAFIASPGTGQVGYTACPFFPHATRPRAVPCPTIPRREHIHRLDARAVAFVDPPHVKGTGYPSGGPYPASGVVMFNAATKVRGHPKPTASWSTCTLPTTQRARCTATINDFLSRYRL